MPPISPKAIGCFAIPPCARATTCCRPTSPCRAWSRPAKAGCAWQSIFMTAPGPSRCACQRRTSSASVRSTKRMRWHGARWARCWCPMAASSQPTCKPARRFLFLAPPVTLVALPLRSRWQMGAACVVAPGRNEKVLKDLSGRFGDRVRTVKLSGNENDDREMMKRAAPGPIDCVLDIMPPSVSPTTVRAAVMTVRPNGHVALMGGVGMAGGPGLELPYPWLMRNNISIHGVWMYPPEATIRLVGLIRSGLIKLDHFEAATFDLDHANDAVAYAAANAGPFKMTVIRS